MARVLITQHDLEREIALWLEENPGHDLHQDVEMAQMELASPGKWEVAKVTYEPTERNAEEESSDVPSQNEVSFDV